MNATVITAHNWQIVSQELSYELSELRIEIDCCG